MKIKWKSNFKVKTVDSPQKMQLWLMTTFLLQAARILVGFPVGLGVGRDAGLEKCHYLQWEERKTYSDGKIQRPLLRTQDPFSPSSFSCLFLYLAHPSSSLPPSPLLILKPSYRPGLCWAKDVAKPGDLFCWCLLVMWTDLYATSAHLLSCPTPALPLLIPHESFGPAHSSILVHLAVFQAVETNFAIFPPGFCQLFPVILDFYSDEELEFLSVPLRPWCSDVRWLSMQLW